MGGAILQKYLQDHQLPGAVLLASVPANGILPMILRLVRRHPRSTLTGLLTLNVYDWVGTPELARDLLISADTPIDVGEFHKQLVRESAAVGLQLMLPFAKPNPVKTPVLVIAGERDVVFTVAEEQATAKKYGTECVVFEGQAHNLMMESGWQRVADTIDDWITRKLELP
jgi:alpha-beta hydrolase superfamily lysophospholipase